jgi:ribose 5-phosphate isomerase B
VRAALVHDILSAHQGVEDDDMNMICFGARVLGCALARELTRSFLAARFTGAARHQLHLGKVAMPEEASERLGGNRQ